MERLRRTNYRDPVTDGERDGSPARREILLDHERYVRPLERVHARALHAPGVATGLEVRAPTGGGLQVLPGVALTARGDHVVLAAGGQAVVPTGLLPVAADGVLVPTTGLDGEHVLTATPAETFDRRAFDDSGGTRFQVDHTPALALHPGAHPPGDGSVVLAHATLTAGAVTALGIGHRTPTTGRLTVRRSAATAGLEPRVGSEVAGELRAGPDALSLSVGGTALTIRGDRVVCEGQGGPALSIDVATSQVDVPGTLTSGNLSVRGGRVGVGTDSPRGRLHVVDEGGFTEPADGDGVVPGSSVPVLVQSDSTAFGVLNAQGRAAFALNVDGNPGTVEEHGIPTLYDCWDGTFRPAIRMKLGNVGIGALPTAARLHVETNLRRGLALTVSGGMVVDRGFDPVIGRPLPVAVFRGRVVVDGTLTKSAGQFRIDHPLDPQRRYLSHSFVESDEMKNVYDGVVVLDERGAAEVDLPGWFEALNERFRYQLTAVGRAAPELHVADRLRGGRFTIAGGAPGTEVCWQVTGVRHDAYALDHPLVVESDKTEADEAELIGAAPASLGGVSRPGVEEDRTWTG